MTVDVIVRKRIEFRIGMEVYGDGISGVIVSMDADGATVKYSDLLEELHLWAGYEKLRPIDGNMYS